MAMAPCSIAAGNPEWVIGWRRKKEPPKVPKGETGEAAPEAEAETETESGG